MSDPHRPVRPPAPAPLVAPVVPAAPASSGSGGSLSTAVVVPAADAQPVTNTTDFPWRLVCSLEIFASNGTKDYGTAWFAGPRLLITAGHCLYAAGYGANGAPGWASKLRVTPARNGNGTPPYGSFDAASFQTVSGWVDSVDAGSPTPRYDYGMIVLANGDIGNKLGWFSTQALADDALNGEPARVVGYPQISGPPTQMWVHDNAIASVDAARLYYHADTRAGESGGPVLMNVSGNLCAVGIHCERDASASAATRITADVLGTIKGWLAQNP